MKRPTTRGPRRPFRWLWRSCLGIWRLILAFVNTLLSISAIALAAIAALIFSRAEFPVPDLIGRALNQIEVDEGIRFEWAAIRFDLTGSIRLVDVSVHDRESDERIVSAEEMLMRFSMSDLIFFRTIHIEAIEINNGSVLMPSMLSASGMNEPLLDRLYLHVRRDGRTWDMAYAIGNVRDATIAGRGSWSGRGSYRLDAARSRTREAERRSLIDRFMQFSAKAKPFLRHLEAVDRPHLDVTIAQNPGDTPRLQIHLFADTVQMPQVHAHRIRLSVSDLNIAEMAGGAIALSIDRMVLPKGIEARRIELFSEVPDIALAREQFAWEQPVRLSIAGWHYGVWNGNSVIANINAVSAHACRGSLAFQLEDTISTIAGEVSFDDRSATVHFDGSVPWSMIYAHPALRNIRAESPELWVGSEGAPRIKGTAVLGTGFAFERADFRGTLEHGYFRGTTIENVSARGSLTPDQVRFSRLRLQNPGYMIDLEYNTHFRTRDYRFGIVGNALPTDLNPLFESWWSRIWTNLRFSGPTLRADLDVQGRWRNPEATRVFGSVRGSDLHINELYVNDAQIRLRREPGFVEVRNVTASVDTRRIAGDLAWMLPSSDGDPMCTLFDLQGSVHPSELGAALSGLAPIQEIIEIDFPNTPTIRASGWALIPRGDADDDDDAQHARERRHVTFTAEMDFPLKAHDILFDSALVTGVLNDNTLFLNIAQASLQGGSAQGTIMLDSIAAKHPAAAFSFNISGASYGGLRTVFGKHLRTPLVDPSIDTTSESDESLISGSADIMIQGTSSAFGEIPISGSGTFAVYEADFGRVHVFGLLSRLLNAIGLNVVSLQLNEAYGSFTMLPDRIVFEETEFFGPRISVQGEGYVTQPAHELFFDVNVFVFPEDRNALQTIIGMVLRPFGHVLAMRLRGDLEDPRWRFAIDPRNIFESEPAEL